MNIPTTFNGASVMPMPLVPGIKAVTLTATNSVGTSTSPFTLQQQVQYWPGADLWTGEFTLPQMTATNAGIWSAWLKGLRGMLNVFPLGDPLRPHPLGQAQGSPVVSGTNNAMSEVLNTRGWTPNMFRQLLPGDYIQVGYRLHVVTAQVNADSNGDAAISIWPSLREQATDGEAVILNNPIGLFRLAENKHSLTADASRLSSITTLKFTEAR